MLIYASLKPKLMLQEVLLATLMEANTYSQAFLSANGVQRARYVHILGDSSEKCKGSNASIVFSYNGKYLANTGSLGSLRLEHMEEFQELSSKTMIFTILPTQAKQRWQCNATFTRSMRQCYYYKSTCPFQCYNLTMLTDF